VSDFYETWDLVRNRFIKEYVGMSPAQLNWRIQPGTLTIGESALHVYGVEISFLSQMTGTSLDEFGTRLKSASVDGVINENPFPFGAEEITESMISRAERLAFLAVEPAMTNLTDELRERSLKSALGPIIDGTGAMARLAYHPGYHQGQVYLIKTAPGFPAA
jgi:hypothetical protein